jgi:hypothetical protein
MRSLQSVTDAYEVMVLLKTSGPGDLVFDVAEEEAGGRVELG